MPLAMIKKDWPTLAGGAVIALFVVVGGLYLGQETVDEMIETSARARAHSFADYILDDRARLDALITGMSRKPDIETQIRTVASLSHISGFTIFDAAGRETFSTASPDHEWLLRNRPGGIETDSRLSEASLALPGEWQRIGESDGAMPLVVMPLLRDGAPAGYMSVELDMMAEKVGHAATLGWATILLLMIVFVATGAPALFYIRRKRKIEEADERIIFLHNHDALTNVLNRRRMHEETDRILATSRATRERMAVWVLDLDGLSEINDGHGQGCGDEVLRITAGRLSEVVERTDLLSRTGSDDFAILQRAVRSEESLKALAHRIIEATNQPIEYNGQKVTPRISLGVAMTPEHGRTYAELIKHAEIAFLHHKNVRRGEYTLFQPAMDEEAHRRRMIEQMLREALDNGGFELFYQPIVSGDCETLVGFEALIRMPDGNGGYIPPTVFVPIAEARGYIKAIGSWVIGEAARQAALWPDHLFVSVNLSAVQFRDGDLVEIVQAALAKAGIEGRRIEIEVVESLLLEQSDDILEQLRALRRLGISIDMDDFGTGYSSLGYLWRFPFDKLKIDQSFMVAFQEGKSSISQILQTIISLAHHLGLKVTAEGVETVEQAELLRSLGCDQLQGFYFGKPKPADQAAADILKNVVARAPRDMALVVDPGVDAMARRPALAL